MKLFFGWLAIFFILANAAAAQITAHSERDKEIESRVEKLLEGRDVGELAKELALKKTAGTGDLLIKLSVFARAGHRAQVSETLREIGKIYPDAPNREQILLVVRRAIDTDDLAARRIFYEHLAPEGDAHAGTFIRAWREKGDAGELEKWLTARAEKSDIWWELWFDLKKSRGAEQPILDALAQKIRENPSDYARVKKYLRLIAVPVWASVMEISPVISYDRYEEDVAWLAETLKTDSPYEKFDLAVRLQNKYPLIAARLLEESLSLAYTEKDARLMGEYLSLSGFHAKEIENPEKAFRNWTRHALVKIYRATKQDLLAQPLVEALTADGAENTESYGGFAAAGAVQSATTARIVENRILTSEKLNENSPDYWISRAAYYAGRQDAAEVRKTYRRALEKFPYQPNDWQASSPRLKILFFLCTGQDENPETVALLRGELTRARKNADANYLYDLLNILDEEFDELYDEFFTNTDLLPKIMAAIPRWLYEEENVHGRNSFLIEQVMESEKWDPKKREAVLTELVKLARRDLPARAVTLVNSLQALDEDRKAIALLEESLKIAPVENKQDRYFEQESLKDDLFDAYLAVGDWRKAEKMYAGGFRYAGNELAKIAVAAAQAGQITDAVRVWKMNAGFDRRDFGMLYELAKTGAKAPLREFYKRMKETDALSEIPDKTLAILQ